VNASSNAAATNRAQPGTPRKCRLPFNGVERDGKESADAMRDLLQRDPEKATLSIPRHLQPVQKAPGRGTGPTGTRFS
jgi:hypothetical protein